MEKDSKLREAQEEAKLYRRVWAHNLDQIEFLKSEVADLEAQVRRLKNMIKWGLQCGSDN